MDEKIFFEYPDCRDVVFILGAGASYSDGVPLQRDLLPIIISDEIEEIKNSEIGREVTSFIKNNFEINDYTKYPKLEAIFGFIDYFLFQKESLSSKYTNLYMYNIKEYLIRLIYFIVAKYTKDHSVNYENFWSAVKENNSNISVITFNYDTLLEQAFHSLYKQNYYIDYCTEFLNYQKKEKLSQYHFWVNPRVPLPILNEQEPKVIKVIKIHGSLNWKYCNCCNQVLLTPWDKEIDLNRNKFLGYTYPEKTLYDIVCPIDENEYQTLIMPPSYVKNLNHPTLSELRNEAGKELRNAKKVVFIGYSLSSADIHIKALLKKNIKPETEIIVVNPKISENFRTKFRSISQNVKFISSSFEKVVTDKEILSEIFK